MPYENRKKNKTKLAQRRSANHTPEQVAPRSVSPELLMRQAQLAPSSLTPDNVLQLQRLVGNQAVGQLLGRDKPTSRTVVQRDGLQVGPAGDKYEQEADSMADYVTRTPTTTTQSSSVQRAYKEPRLQRQQDDELQMKRISTIQRDGGGAGFAVDGKFEKEMKGSGRGKPLPPDLQAEFGSKMGADMSSVRVHTDNKAAGLSRQIQAKAFTHKNNIYLGEGQYKPNTIQGKRLLAHEATHTIQQGAVRAKGSGVTSGVQRAVIQRDGEKKGKEQKKTGKDILDVVLHNGILFESFYEFSKKEWSAENVECYRDIALYKLKPTRSKAINIYDTYLAGKAAPKEINIDSTTAQAIKPTIDRYRKEKSQQSKSDRFKRKFISLFKGSAGQRDLFKDIEVALKINLSDTYSRFRYTKEFKSDLAVLRGSWDPLGYQLS